MMWSRAASLLRTRLPPTTTTAAGGVSAPPISSCLRRISLTTTTSSGGRGIILPPHHGRPSPVPSCRSYVTRAHPRPIPEFPVNAALQMVLEGIEERKLQRAARWERNREKRLSKGGAAEDSSPYRNQDEAVELSINLNVDPRRPGQALRGSLVLPHGTGKTVSCLVFTADPDVKRRAEQAGHMAGGDDLIDRVSAGDVPLEVYQRALATKDVMPDVQKRLARLLGPRGLMPNPKTNTVFDDGSALLSSLEGQANTVTYRTEAAGIVHFVLGRGSFEPQKLLENMQAICQTVQEIKPETYGKGKKKKGGGGGGKKKVSKNVKYWLKAHLTATQGRGSVRMDLRTVDPTSPFFMKEPE